MALPTFPSHKSKLIDSIKQRVEARVLRVLATSLTSEQNKELSEKVKQENLNEEEIIDYLVKTPQRLNSNYSRHGRSYTEMKEETDTLMQVATVEGFGAKGDPTPRNRKRNTALQVALFTQEQKTQRHRLPTNLPTPPVSNQYY